MFKREQDEFLHKERIECEECRKLEMGGQGEEAERLVL